MTKTKFKRVALYTRVSKDRTGEAESPELHIAEARRWAEAMGHTVVGEYIDRNVSGYKVTMASREQWKRLCVAIEAGKIDAVCVQRLDRFSRRFREALDTIEWLKGHGVGFLCASEQVDTSTPLGEALAGLMFAIGEQFIVSLSANISRTWESHAVQGKPHITKQRCYGYTKDYKQIPTEAAVVRSVVKDITDGRSLNSISVDLNKRNVKTSAGNRWSRTSVLQTFRRAALAGLREHTTEADRKAGRPGTITQGTWKGIITPEQREALLIRLATKRGSAKGVVVSSEPTSLLTGVVRCGTCGEKMAKRLDRYACSKGRSNTKCCGKVAAMAARVDEIAVEALLDYLSRAELEPVPKAQDPKVLAVEIENDERKLRALSLQRFVDEAIGDDEYRPARDAINERMEATRAALAAIENTTSLRPGSRSELDEWWADATLTERRAAIRDAFSAVVIQPVGAGKGKGGCRFDPERVRLEWKLWGRHLVGQSRAAGG